MAFGLKRTPTSGEVTEFGRSLLEHRFTTDLTLALTLAPLGCLGVAAALELSLVEGGGGRGRGTSPEKQPLGGAPQTWGVAAVDVELPLSPASSPGPQAGMLGAFSHPIPPPFPPIPLPLHQYLPVPHPLPALMYPPGPAFPPAVS